MKSAYRLIIVTGLALSILSFAGISLILYIKPADLFSQRLVLALIGLGTSLLLMGILAVEMLNQKKVASEVFHFSVWRVFILVYVFVPVVLVVPVWMVAMGMGVTSGIHLFFDRHQFFSLPEPWVWLVQGSILFLLLLPKILPLRQWFTPFQKPIQVLGISLLSGWMIALITLFSYHLGLRVVGVEANVLLAPVGIQRAVAGILMIGVLPISEQLFFRKYLIQALSSQYSTRQATWITAFLFALVQGRPLLFLPAILFSLFFQRLVDLTGDVRIAIIAHAVVNAFAWILNWALAL